MSFDRQELARALAIHNKVARVVVADVRGSAPREVGASMLVWKTEKGLKQSGTIGGGALEYEAAAMAFDRHGVTRHPLGPSLGQCCGGSVTLLTEQFTQAPKGNVFARGPGDMPLAVRKLLAEARSQGTRLAPQLIDGWMIEPFAAPQTPLWIYGAGHVGRALVATLSPLPEFDITWVDTGMNRFPDSVAKGVTVVPAADPCMAARHAPDDAQHLILTFSHQIDLDLCHTILQQPFAFCGLIGSDTKWARFRNRLANLGHSDAQILRICCPIGQKSLGKHPQAIAIGVAAALLSSAGTTAATRGIAI